MKTKFKMVGKGETKVQIEVLIDTHRDTLFRNEVRQKKASLQNEIHGVLRRFGYDVSEIRIVR